MCSAIKSRRCILRRSSLFILHLLREYATLLANKHVRIYVAGDEDAYEYRSHKLDDNVMITRLLSCFNT